MTRYCGWWLWRVVIISAIIKHLGSVGKAIVRMIVRIIKRVSVSRNQHLNSSFARSSEWSSEFLSDMVVTWSNFLPQHILHSTMNYCVFCYGVFRRDTNMPRIHYRFTEKQEIDRYSWFVSDRISQHCLEYHTVFTVSHSSGMCLDVTPISLGSPSRAPIIWGSDRSFLFLQSQEFGTIYLSATSQYLYNLLEP